MNLQLIRTIVAAGCLFGAGVAQAQRLEPIRRSQPARVGRPTLSYQAASRIVVAGGSADDLLYRTPKGLGYDGVGSILVERTDGNYLCSGALLDGGRYMLTAAHCLADGNGQLITQKTTSYFFPPGTPNSTREIIASNEFYVHPLYTGEVIDAHDIAIIKLGTLPSYSVRAAAYNLYGGNPFGRVAELVGSGANGTGTTGSVANGGFELADRRRGNNRVDLSWTDPAFFGFFGPGFFGNADPTGLVADFDNGLDQNDAACLIGGAFGTAQFCDLGLGENEVILGPGDSGGPLFINGRIAGVASYGLTFGRQFGDTDGFLNDTYGEFSGWASTSYNDGFISSFISPEPSSILLIAVGMLSVAALARRRQS